MADQQIVLQQQQVQLSDGQQKTSREEVAQQHEQQITTQKQVTTEQQPHQQTITEQQQQQTSSQQQKVATSTSSSSSVSESGVKTTKTSKKVVTSKKTTSKTVKSTKTSTSSSSVLSADQLKSSTTTSSSSLSQSASSHSVVIQSSGETFSQHRATFSRSGEISELLNLDKDKAALEASQQPVFQILLPSTPENAEATVIQLKAEDLVNGEANQPGKSAVLNFNMSEFESQSIDVRADGNKIEVHAKKKHINPDGEERSEEFSRVYELPTEEKIDPAKLQTSMFQDGILTIELPVGANITVEVAPTAETGKEAVEVGHGNAGDAGCCGVVTEAE